jgi:small subunit ribosomal protein S9
LSLDDAKRKIFAPLVLTNKIDKVDITIKTSGGGIIGQIEAISLGLSRAFEKMDSNLRSALKKEGFLTHDSRIKERKTGPTK